MLSFLAGLGSRPRNQVLGLAGLLAVLVPLLPAAQAEASHPGRNGALLVGRQLQAQDGGLTDLGLIGFNSVGAFSPKGDRVAYVASPDGDVTRNTLRVRASGGADTPVGTPSADIGGRIHSLAWSPDERFLALGIERGDGGAVVRVALDGGEAVVLAVDAGRHLGHVDWNPVRDLVSYTKMDIDLFTVPGAGGASVQRTHECSYPEGERSADCTSSGSQIISKSHAEWAPDGSRLVLEAHAQAVLPNQEPDRRFVGVLALGDEEPTVVAEQFPRDGAYVAGVPVWSPDGSAVAYYRDQTAGAAAGTYAVLSGGAQQRISDQLVTDWQPCPTGTCSIFTASGPRPTPTASATPSPTAGPTDSPTGGASPTAGPQPSTPSLALSPGIISAGQTTTVTYRGTPGSTLTILAKTQPATGFSAIGSVVLDSSGAGTSTHRPQRNTRIAARTAEGVVSASAPLIQVRSVASFSLSRVGARTYTFAGRVYPARPDRLVNVYRNGTLVAQARTDTSGIYRVTRALAAGTYGFQARTASDTYNLGTSSTVRTVRVF